MAEKLSVKRHNRMLRRNLEGLLSKCYRYGKLRGVELGIYIDYTERGYFVSYETPHFTCQDDIIAKKRLPSSQNYLPDSLPVGVQRKLIGTASKPASATAPQTTVRPAASSETTVMRAVRAFPLGELPNLPRFDFMVLERGEGTVYIDG